MIWFSEEVNRQHFLIAVNYNLRQTQFCISHRCFIFSSYIMWYMEYLLKRFEVVGKSLSISFTTWCGLFLKSWHLERNLEKFWRHFRDILLSMISKIFLLKVKIGNMLWKTKMYIVSLERLVSGVAGLCSSCAAGGGWVCKCIRFQLMEHETLKRLQCFL